MNAWISLEEIVLIAAYVGALFLFIRRFSDFDWRSVFMAAALIGVGTGIFVWPWAIIIFGWPGASLGAVVSSALELQTGAVTLVCALLSATAAMTVLALGIALLLLLPIKAWKNLRTGQVHQKE